MHIIWHDDAWNDYLFWQEQDKKVLKKINTIIQSINSNGYNCIGKPEHLSENLSDYWSIRIDKKNRIVFKITNSCIEIIQCGSHYRDK